MLRQLEEAAEVEDALKQSKLPDSIQNACRIGGGLLLNNNVLVARGFASIIDMIPADVRKKMAESMKRKPDDCSKCGARDARVRVNDKHLCSNCVLQETCK